MSLLFCVGGATITGDVEERKADDVVWCGEEADEAVDGVAVGSGVVPSGEEPIARCPGRALDPVRCSGTVPVAKELDRQH